MTRRKLLIGAAVGSAVVAIAALIGVAGHYDFLRGDDDDDDEGEDRGALVRAMRLAKISLQQGLAASEQEGQPIAGKFEVDRGNLQLSVRTSKDGRFTEVLVDYSSGNVIKVEPITRGEDLAAAESQSAAMTKAKMSLRDAVEKTIAEAADFRAIGVVPELKGGRAAASVLLLKGEEFKIVNQPLE
jgi:hypothetical protein